MTKFWFYNNLLFVILIFIISFFASELVVGVFLVFSFVYMFFYIVYIATNRVLFFIKDVAFKDRILLIPIITLLMVILYVFCILLAYKNIDKSAASFFYSGVQCNNTFKCHDGNKWIKVSSPIEKNYKVTIENGCVVVRSPSYAFEKFFLKKCMVK